MPADADAYDYIVIGGGSAGCVLANRLSADPAVSVLLLEAGPRDRSPLLKAPGGLLPLAISGRFNWRYRSAPQRHLGNRELYLSRGKVLGGSSSINGMVYCRGTARDYDMWRQLGNRGWSFEDVLPYFRRAETYEPGGDAFHGSDGPVRVSRPGARHPFSQAFLEAARQAGFPINDDTNGALRDGFGPTDITASHGRRSSTAQAYLAPIRRRRNLTITTGAQVQRVIVEAGEARRVAYTIGKEAREVEARREIILSAGSVNSAQLLMLSGIGPAEHLAAHGIAVVRDLPGVGSNLQDHLAVYLRITSREPISLFKYLSPVQGSLALGRYLLTRRGPLADPGIEVVGFVRTRPELAEPDLKFTLTPALYRNNGREIVPQHGYGVHFSCLRPKSRGTVRLAGADPTTPPVIDPNYLERDEDLRTARDGLRVARRIFAQPAFDRFRGEELEPGREVESDAAIDDYIRTKAEADYHASGTCRMGSGSDAVVDERLRIHGIGRLRVVDASIMPRLIGGNTNMAVIMIAEKAADMIKEDHGRTTL